MELPHAHRWDIVARRAIWFGISLAAIVLGVICWAVRGLNYGIDFQGGALLRYQFERQAPTDPDTTVRLMEQARAQLQALGLGASRVQIAEGKQVVVRVPLAQARNDTEAARRQEQIQQKLEEQFGAEYGKITNLSRELVGGVISKELGQWALLALAMGSIFILGYVGVRYEFRFAVACILAMLHDCFILIGVFAILQFEVDKPFVAAILTVAGYSVNDTIVIFDRIRENMRLHKREPFDTVVNASLWQTMARSINTVLTTLFTLVALFFLGGPAIKTFSLALIVGITSGAYSSIFSASPLVVLWHKLAGGELAGPAPAAVAPATPEPPPPPLPEPQPDLPTTAPEVELEAGEPALEPAPAPAAASETKPARPRKRKQKPGGKRKRRRRH